MKMISIILLTICLSSCRSFPEIKKPITRCATFIERLGENTYSGKCRCHEYIINFQSGLFKKVSESKDYSLEKCSNHVALSPADWGILRFEFDKIHSWLNKMKKRLK